MSNASLDVTERPRPLSERLNQHCFCVTLDQDALESALAREASVPAFAEKFLAARPHLYSNVPVFLPWSAIEEMQAIVAAVEATSRLAPYRAAVLARAGDIAQRDHGPAGALMGYDFHLSADGPKLIEINTNAGGAFINAVLARAQRACCAEMGIPHVPNAVAFEDEAIAMFLREWRRQRGTGAPHRIAIVDDNPQDQFLYPEFLLARQMLAAHGIETVIADAGSLDYQAGRLSFDGDAIDLVYNRVTDFDLSAPAHRALRDAYADDAVVVTPNPHNHAILADKRNLVLLSDPAMLAGWGVPPETASVLAAGVPRTLPVTEADAGTLWRDRNRYFFKPFAGHGGKAVYRGDKITKRVWEEIVRGGYVAQALVPPGERMVKIDGVPTGRKVDVRLYTYEGALLLATARLYQGQTTNFRTAGSGFAPILVT